MKKFLLWSLMLAPMLMFAQLSITANPTEATCAGNGSVSLTIDGTTSGYIYDISLVREGGSITNSADYREINVTASSTSINDVLTSLNAGTWNVTVNETNSGNPSGSATKQFTITENLQNPTVQTEFTPNCSNSNIEVTAQNGSFTAYRLLTQSGNEVRPLQTSNIFTNVVPGDYRVEATYACGVKTQDFTIHAIENNYKLLRPNDPSNTNSVAEIYGFRILESCNSDGSRTVNHIINYRLNNKSIVTDDRYPITVKYELKDNNGSYTEIFTKTFTSHQNYVDNRDVQFDLLPTSVSVRATITDACNVVHTQEDNINYGPDVGILKKGQECGTGYYSADMIDFAKPIKIEFMEHPAGFLPSQIAGDNQTADDVNKTILYNEYSRSPSTIFIGSETKLLPFGDYKIKFTDECGAEVIKTISHKSDMGVKIRTTTGCGVGEISARIFLSTNATLKEADIINARFVDGPAGLTYPFDLTSYINDGQIYLENLPSTTGTVQYKIEVDNNSCSVPFSGNLNVSDFSGKKINISGSTLEPKCGSFTYTLTVDDLHSASTEFNLQRFNEGNGQWWFNNSKFLRGPLSSPKEIVYNMNNAANGRYRMIITHHYYSKDGNSSNQLKRCEYVYEEFEYNSGEIKIEDYFVTQCGGASNNTYDLIVDAIGAEPMQYKIVSKDGDTAAGTPYQNDAFFLGLEAGNYEVEVKDVCGNTVKAFFAVSGVKSPTIIAELCEGEFGTLKTSGLSRFQTEWYKNGTLVAGDDINDNVLKFNPYTEANDLGEYKAKILYTGGANCGPLDSKPITLTATTDDAPKSGTATANPVTTIVDDNDDGKTNLFHYLQDNSYDDFGTWTEVSAENGGIDSGLLSGDEWVYKFAASGTYTFKYTINGTCTGSSETLVTIQYKAKCDRPFNPTPTPTESFSKIGITNLNKNNVENWPHSVPNGFIILESNTKGFTITRISDPENNIAEPKEGMLVFDTDEGTDGCFKLYNGTSWKCMINCNDQL